MRSYQQRRPPVSDWRVRALELFPDLRPDIQAAKSVGSFWCELCSRFDTHYEHCGIGETESPELIRAIYLYATWCTRAESVDVFNAATIGFYEHVSWHALRCAPSIYELIIEDLVTNIGLPEIKSMAGTFGYLIESDELDRFLADCEKADRDLQRQK
jgi:hypothetical protein